VPRAKEQPPPQTSQPIAAILDAPGIAILPLDTRWAATLRAGTQAPRFVQAVRTIEGTTPTGPTTWQAQTIEHALKVLILHAQEQTVLGDPGIRDQNVQAAKRLFSPTN
jgi:hypothetical protein